MCKIESARSGCRVGTLAAHRQVASRTAARGAGRGRKVTRCLQTVCLRRGHGGREADGRPRGHRHRRQFWSATCQRIPPPLTCPRHRRGARTAACTARLQVRPRRLTLLFERYSPPTARRLVLAARGAQQLTQVAERCLSLGAADVAVKPTDVSQEKQCKCAPMCASAAADACAGRSSTLQ